MDFKVVHARFDSRLAGLNLPWIDALMASDGKEGEDE